ncbi:hypothetical protein CNMCM5793_006707 [Aspergillus hiratsukae]|uniref:BTB domain-containing protein n=1 Tax=Aspergillus hiratsukae TaxID=1194566 RepID=A0A8H6PN86_9EURO|nr:hypothetical protein CNMCM5793_006707 [Aspergillus hiratsukae]KAF7157748.1 hypothetical protein CNMCM6106_003731 [Aspergillus hiratsukae]
MRRKRDENEEDSIEERAQKKMLQLNQDGKLSDFKFTVWNEPFYVNKIVLSAISPYFAKKFEAEWKSEKSVDLRTEHSIEAFSCMIEYIYTYTSGQLTEWLQEFDPVPVVQWYFEVYHMAEKYKLPGLKEQVLERLPSAVKALYCPGELHDVVDWEYISDSELGKVFVAAVADNVHIMQAFEDLDRVKLFLVMTPTFAADLISELVKRRILTCQCGS